MLRRGEIEVKLRLDRGSVAAIFFGKEKFCTGAGRCVLSFSQYRAILRGENVPQSAPSKPVLEASESGIRLVCARFLQRK